MLRLRDIHFRNLNLRNRLIILFIVISIIPVILTSLGIYRQSAGLLQTRIGEYTNFSLEQIRKAVDSDLSAVDKVAIEMLMDYDFVDYMQSHKKTDNPLEEKRNIIGEIEAVCEKNEISLPIRLYRQDGTVISNLFFNYQEPGFMDSGWYKRAVTGSDIKFYVTVYEKEENKLNPQVIVLKLVRPFVDLRDNQKYGVIVIDIYEEYIKKSFSDAALPENSRLYLIDGNGFILANSFDEAAVGSSLHPSYSGVIKGSGGFKTVGNEAVFYKRILEGNMYLLYVVPSYILQGDNKIIGNMVLLFLILCTIVIILASAFFSKYITQPVYSLMDIMRQVEKGNFNVQAPVADNDEISRLNAGFNNMIQYINNLIEKDYKIQLELRNAQIKMHQAQINPHFIYNTLETINWMAIEYNAGDISEIVKSLGLLLRESISSNSQVETVRESINHISHYLNIQKVRYEDKLEVLIDVPEEMMEMKMLKLVLQPLVENAISHGIEPKVGKGIVSIRAYMEDNDIVFEVADDGVGFSEEQLERFNRLLCQDTYFDRRKSPGSHIGLLNVDRRIKLFFDGNYGISIKSCKNSGTCITVRLPGVSDERWNYIDKDIDSG